jgi:hypothetical protein
MFSPPALAGRGAFLRLRLDGKTKRDIGPVHRDRPHELRCSRIVHIDTGFVVIQAVGSDVEQSVLPG